MSYQEQTTITTREQIQQLYNQAKELKQEITNTIDSVDWRSSEYHDLHIEQLETVELDIVGIIRKLE